MVSASANRLLAEQWVNESIGDFRELVLERGKNNRMNWKGFKRTMWIAVAMTVFAGMSYASNVAHTVQASPITQHYGRSSSADAETMALFGIGLLVVAGLIRWRLRT